MNQLDAYYRAWIGYRAAIAGRRECVRDSRAFAEAEGQGRIAVTRMVCTVDEAWISAIEAGLVHIEKAIKEDRQFIYSNGEVIPIERVKHVSKDSVQHLARHAELISRVEEGQDLTPDKLYTVERLSDYAVYENRFLYMLLCYLRDFVTLRYQKIRELSTQYEGSLSVAREVVSAGRTTRVRIDLDEERRDDPYLQEHNEARPLIDRMDLILKTILAFLATPLMESAGKAAMLKPPITKTNVLKMDNNFKGAVALYDYIIAYEGDGYTVREEVRELSPIEDEAAEDLAEAEILLSFFTYRYGLELGEALRAAREIDEVRAREEELRLRGEQLASLRRRMENAEITAEAYILALEQQGRALQNEADRVETLVAEMEADRVRTAEIVSERDALQTRLDGIDEELDEERRAMDASYAEAARALEATHRRDRETSDAAHAAAVRELRSVIAERDGEIERLQAEMAAMQEKQRLLSARVTALRHASGDMSRAEMETLTDEESFNELERELEAFMRFYKREWTLAKRRIRKDIVNFKYIKGQGGES